MRHYTLAEWVDYVRGLGDPAWRDGVRAHLLSGCRACCRSHETLVRIAAAVATEDDAIVPADAVRKARAIFVEFTPARVCSLPALLTRLVGDASAQPVAAGVRGRERDARRAVFRTGEDAIDLRVERRPGDAGIVLIGQWLAGAPRRPGLAPRRPVVLTSGRQVVATTATNDHGEFQLEYEPAGQMQLHIGSPEGVYQIQIPLARLHADLRS